MNGRFLSRGLVVLATAILLLLPARGSARTIHDQGLSVTFTVPDQAQPVELPNAVGGARYAYTIDHPDGTRIAIAVSALGGTIGREHIDPGTFASQFPAGAEVSRETVRWRSFDVDSYRARFTAAGQTIVARIVQVPIRAQAVQFVVEGPAERDAEIATLTRAVVGSIEAPSNWLTPFERGERLGRGVGTLLFVAVGIGWLVRRFRRRSPT
jgi:hypothetical protein